MVLETPRLILRPVLAEDAHPLAKLWSDPEVTRFVGCPRDYETVVPTVLREAAGPCPERTTRWPLLLRDGNDVIGDCGLLEKLIDGRQETELVYFLQKRFWGQGLATEAARMVLQHGLSDLKLSRVVALIDPENIASERVAQKIGMTLESEVVRSGHLKRLYTAATFAIGQS